MPPKRLTLLERQQKLLEESGFSTPSAPRAVPQRSGSRGSRKTAPRSGSARSGRGGAIGGGTGGRRRGSFGRSDGGGGADSGGGDGDGTSSAASVRSFVSTSSSVGGSMRIPAGAVPSDSERRRRQRGGWSSGFVARQERAAAASGRDNAASSSRVAEAMPALDEDAEWSGGDSGDEGAGTRDRGAGGSSAAAPERRTGGGAASVASRLSYAPSLHPSVAGTHVSMALSEVTIGAGDATGYWDFAHRTVEKGDLAHRCRECKQPFTRLGEPLTERRGARLSMRYHAECFSGYADPRSQAGSSHHVGRHAGSQLDAAPSTKAGSKMRTSQHFDSGSDKRLVGGAAARGGNTRAGSGTSTRREGATAAAAAATYVGPDRMSGAAGKIAGFGTNTFGSRSAKGQNAGATAAAAGWSVTSAADGGLTEAQLKAHTERMAADGAGDDGGGDGGGGDRK